ncbi:MAG: peptide chain release factor N(5)-glutamine methyltransferase [Cyanobacteria bacterium J06641_5]
MTAVVSGLALYQWRRAAREKALAVAIPPEEVDWLLQAKSALDPLALRLESFQRQPHIELALPLAELDRLWEQRLRDRMPVQYLAGETPWRDFQLQVSPAVLIPRPETELLVDVAIAATQESCELACGNWADLGTGSGAIAIALVRALPSIQMYGVDLSPAALAVARANADRLGVGARIKWLRGSWFEPLLALSGGAPQLSAVVANPPYIPSAEIPNLQPEVADREPHLALDGGPDGLDCVRELVAVAPRFLQSGGLWGVELACGQAASVVKLLQAQGDYKHSWVVPDLAGIDRFVFAYRR